MNSILETGGWATSIEILNSRRTVQKVSFAENALYCYQSRRTIMKIWQQYDNNTGESVGLFGIVACDKISRGFDDVLWNMFVKQVLRISNFVKFTTKIHPKPCDKPSSPWSLADATNRKRSGWNGERRAKAQPSTARTATSKEQHHIRCSTIDCRVCIEASCNQIKWSKPSWV